MALTRPLLISIVIPCYNEGEIIKESLFRLKTAAATFSWPVEIVVADDGSTDDTAKIARQAGVTVTSYETNKGKGCALRTGVAATTGDVLLLTDADLAYGTQALKEAHTLLCSSGVDLVCGSRRLCQGSDNGYPPLRKLASRGFAAFQKIALGLPMSDTQCGLKALKGDVGRALFAACTVDDFACDLELLALAMQRGCTYRELPVRLETHGASSAHLVRDSLRMAKQTLRIRRLMRKP